MKIINELDKSVKEIEKSLSKAECRIERNACCDDKINDLLYRLGVSCPTKENSEQRVMLVNMDELMLLKQAGKFDFKSEPCDNDDVENSTSDLQEDEELDELLFEVAQWGIAENGISIAKVQRHFCLGFGRAGKIVDQLCSLGICGSSTDDMELHPMLVGMDELLLLERSGRFG